MKPNAGGFGRRHSALRPDANLLKSNWAEDGAYCAVHGIFFIPKMAGIEIVEKLGCRKPQTPTLRN
jgi:hypothetical protein